MNHTHYHRPTKTWFTPELCENCGGLIQGPNAVTLHGPESFIATLKPVAELPPEGYYSDETGGEACDGCGG